ncbi:MAG: flagellar basal body rod protein FlgB [Nitriliruptoraceae bacterium]
MWDVTTTGVITALDGLSARSGVRAHNIANAETPGYRANQVLFQDALQDAWQRGRPGAMRTSEVPTPSIVGPNGNSVDLETELVESMKDGVLRDTMNAAFNFKTGNLRVAMGGQR